MQAIHDTEIYSDSSEFYEDEEVHAEEELSEGSTGGRRVLRLALILIVLVLATAFFLLVVMPAIQAMIQPPLPPLAPALQV